MGPLSPRLFAVYMEELIEKLIESGIGNKLNGIKTGVIMYADDLLKKIEDTVMKLQDMLKIISN